jgi:hypothetical protein
MNRVVDQTVSPGGDVDALLGAFFQEELPRPWPAFQPPGRGRTLLATPTPRRPAFAIGSRLALAASVALLLLCGWLLSGKFPGLAGRPDGLQLGPPSAERPALPLPPPLPDSRPAPGKVKSNLILEQGKDGTGIRIEVEEVPSSK